ncbi:MAG: DUF928 domain-containing protein [Planctomycetota bacterium]
MRGLRLLSVLLLTLQLAPALGDVAAARAAAPQRPEPVELEYQPPARGAPKVRVASGSRGPEGRLPSLYVLTPDHVGLTVQASPRLYWYQAHATDLPVTFSLSRGEAIFPDLEFTLVGSRLEGQVCVDLADYAVSLEPGMEYCWIVAIVPDPQARSRDVVAEGRIQRIEPPAELASVEESELAARAAACARAGVWYDAFAAVNDLIAEDPNDPRWRRWRGEMLAGVGLSEPAEALGEGSAGTVAAARPAAPTYASPRRGAPSRLVSSASRQGSEAPADTTAGEGERERPGGGEHADCSADGKQSTPVLLPPGGGATVRAQPALFWFVSRNPEHGVRLRLRPVEADRPLCEIVVRAFGRAGIQRVELAKLGLALDAGRVYEWRASLLSEPPDAEPRLAARGTIRPQQPPEGLRSELATAEPDRRAAVLARHGMWCDALAEVSALVAARPGDGELRRRRARLLRKAGLRAPADWDARRAGL